MRTLSRNQIRTIDQLAIEEYAIPGVVLMENAARSVTAEILRMIAGAPATVGIVCGGGNNGGDGYAVARQLHNAGVKVEVFAAVEALAMKGDAKIMRTIVERMLLPLHPVHRPESLDGAAGAALERSTILVDALLGTGFTGDIRPSTGAIIRRINALGMNGRTVVAVDLPSGLDADSGAASRDTVRADATVTFVAAKKGFANLAAKSYVGRVVIGDIGAPPELINGV